jgi:flavin-binding protein dodecin
MIAMDAISVLDVSIRGSVQSAPAKAEPALRYNRQCPSRWLVRRPADLQQQSAEECAMSIAKSSEISASSDKSFEDAIRKGIKRFGKTIENIEGAWVKEQKVKVDKGEVTEYRVTMIVTFILKS